MSDLTEASLEDAIRQCQEFADQCGVPMSIRATELVVNREIMHLYLRRRDVRRRRVKRRQRAGRIAARQRRAAHKSRRKT